jgi:hypothetical protein
MSAFGGFAVLFFNYLAVPKVALAASHSDTTQRISGHRIDMPQCRLMTQSGHRLP